MKKELIFAFSGLTLLLVGCSSSTDTGFKISTKSSSDKYPATEEVIVKQNENDADLKDTLKINGHKKTPQILVQMTLMSMTFLTFSPKKISHRMFQLH